jgi:2-polyprenyl-3-methyl-5-hydroxy-6-metoxy-1,4-benzoquinol methylase
MSTQENATTPDARRDLFIERLLASARGTFDIFGTYIGVRLGFYDALAEAGPLTSSELAHRTGTHERYAREWLEQQAVMGTLTVDDERANEKARRFTLPPEHAEVLVAQESLNYMAPLARLIAGAVLPLDQVLRAYRTGGGVSYEDYGVDLREGQAGINRPMFLHELGSTWIPAMPDVHARLLAEPAARVADVGCGAGWSTIGMARAFPKAHVDGFDLDAASIDLARENAAGAGFGDRLRFWTRDAGDPRLAGTYDLVTAFECIHDMSQPVKALVAMRALAGRDGTVLVVDERVGESFSVSGNDIDWMMYGWSILHCLPVGKAEEPSAETGTVMRPATLRRYAEEAGYRAVEILPIDSFFFRFYRLTP